MLRLILGGIALATVGYGVKKYIEDDFKDSIEDKIQDGIFKVVDSLDQFEEKMGLNEYSFSKKDIQELKELKESGKLDQFGDTFNDITDLMISSSTQSSIEKS